MRQEWATPQNLPAVLRALHCEAVRDGVYKHHDMILWNWWSIDVYVHCPQDSRFMFIRAIAALAEGTSELAALQFCNRVNGDATTVAAYLTEESHISFGSTLLLDCGLTKRYIASNVNMFGSLVVSCIKEYDYEHIIEGAIT